MSAQQQMRHKLDELMGTGRDGTQNPIHYSDPKVCRCFLLGLCPHEALAGTKMALGECHKIHDYALKADFENSSKTCRSNQHRFYELTVLAHLQRVIRYCEIMDRAKKGRLSRCQAQTRGAAASEKQAQLKRYDNMVDKKIAEAEELGSLGMVEESLVLIREIEMLKTKRTGLEKYLFRKSSEPVKEQKQTICEECQLCIGLDNNEQRMANHSSGRLHHAILAMRRRITELRAKLEGVNLTGDWERLHVQQQMRMSSNPALVSTRARSCSPYSRSSSVSRSASRYRSHSKSRRSYSRSRSSSGSHYRRSRSRTRPTTRSRNRTESRSRTRSRSSCRPRTRSRSGSNNRLRTEPTTTSWSRNRYGTKGKVSYTKTSPVTRTRSKGHQGISAQQCTSVKDDAKSCSFSVSSRDECKNLLDGAGKPAGLNKKRQAQTQNTAWHMASGNASNSLSNCTDRKPCSGRPQPESALTGLPEKTLGKAYPDVSFTKPNLRPKSNTRSRSKTCSSKSRSPGRRHTRSRCSKKEKMRTRTKVDAGDREDKSGDENPRDSTARAEHEKQVDPGPTDSKNRTKDLETREKVGGGERGQISISSSAPKFKKRKVIKRSYRSRGRRSVPYEESSKSTPCSEERYSRRGAKGSLKKRKTKRHERRHSTTSSESPLRRKPSKNKRARKTVTKKRKKLSSKSKTRTKTVRKKLQKKRSVSPSPSESWSVATDTDSSASESSSQATDTDPSASKSSSLATDTDSYEEKSRRKRRYRAKQKMAWTSNRKSKGNDRNKCRKGSTHKKRRKL